jgi:Lsr2
MERAMAQKVQTLFIDDLDGSEAEGSVQFGLDGADYEIDLNAQHAEELRAALGRYVAAARRVSGTGRPAAARSGRRSASGDVDTKDVRKWAKDQGIELKDRGRVPTSVVARFRAATGK